MPTFRNRNSGQTVTVTDDPSYLSGLARWERIEEGSSTPVSAPPTEPVTEPTPVASPQVEDVTAEVPDAEPAMPGPDADRDEWVAYAKAQGKTDAQLKGKKIDTIRGWFVADE